MMNRLKLLTLACIICAKSTTSLGADVSQIHEAAPIFLQSYCELKVIFSHPNIIPSDNPKIAKLADLSEDILNDAVEHMKANGFFQPTKLAAIGNQLAPEYLKNPALIEAVNKWKLEAAGKVCIDTIERHPAYKAAITKFNERPTPPANAYTYGVNSASTYDRTCVIEGDKFAAGNIITQLAAIEPGAKELYGQRVEKATAVQVGFALARTRPYRGNESCKSFITTQAVAEEMRPIVEMYPNQKFSGKVVSGEIVAQAVRNSDAETESRAKQRQIEEQKYQEALRQKMEWRQSGSSLQPLR